MSTFLSNDPVVKRKSHLSVASRVANVVIGCIEPNDCGINLTGVLLRDTVGDGDLSHVRWDMINSAIEYCYAHLYVYGRSSISTSLALPAQHTCHSDSLVGHHMLAPG